MGETDVSYLLDLIDELRHDLEKYPRTVWYKLATGD
jgi:ribonuclease D